MLKVDTSGVEAFRRELKLEMARLDREISKVYVGWTRRIFTELVQGSPQWSGNMTANWKFSVGQPDYSYAEIFDKAPPGSHGRLRTANWGAGAFQAGHPSAVNAALSGMWAVKIGSWRDKVFMTNSTPMENSLFALQDAIRLGVIRLRPVNLVNDEAVTLYSVATKERLRASP